MSAPSRSEVGDHRFTQLEAELLRRAHAGAGLFLLRDEPGFDAQRRAARVLVRGGLLDLRGVTTGTGGGLTYLLTTHGAEVASIVGAA